MFSKISNFVNPHVYGIKALVKNYTSDVISYYRVLSLNTAVGLYRSEIALLMR